jgi:hypothetical protein
MNGGKYARLDIGRTPAGSRSNPSAKMPPLSSESDEAVSDLNYNHDRVLRDSLYGIVECHRRRRPNYRSRRHVRLQ